MHAVTRIIRVNRIWAVIGWGGVIASFFILSYYSVIAGWTFAYIEQSLAGSLYENLSPDTVNRVFSELLANPKRLIFWHTLAMLTTALIAAGGIRTGIERSIRLFMPTLFFLLSCCCR